MEGFSGTSCAAERHHRKSRRKSIRAARYVPNKNVDRIWFLPPGYNWDFNKLEIVPTKILAAEATETPITLCFVTDRSRPSIARDLEDVIRGGVSLQGHATRVRTSHETWWRGKSSRQQAHVLAEPGGEDGRALLGSRQW